jgi:ketosteroid isomerase-like protein
MAAVDLMRRYLAAVQAQDWPTAFSLVADDVTVHVPGSSALAGEHRGRDAFVAYVEAALARAHGAEVEVELVDMLSSDERVALIVRERFRRADGDVEIRRANVYTVRDERIGEIWIFEADQYAVDALFGG